MNDEFVADIGSGKQRIVVHVDRATYRILLGYSSRNGEATPNHAAFRLVVRGVKQLAAEYEWAATILNEERIRGLEQV